MSTIAAMREPTFHRLRDIVYSTSGITLGPRKEALVAARVGKRMRVLGMTDFDDYVALVESDDGEIVDLLDAVSTNVTSFFREAEHFTLLAEEAQRLYAAGQRRFRYWSAACSSGEEPYSLAMTLREVLPSDVDLRILATDISTRVLSQAAYGVYPEARVRDLSRDTMSRWFTPVRGAAEPSFRVKPQLTGTVLFRRLNLSTPPFPMQGPFDAVLCRNVMIYFDEAVRSGLLQESHRLLASGGFLLLGHAESLAGMNAPFKYVRPSVYRKL